ncbi:MAG: hypothetical protein JNL98_01260 [Bryobacterales bacterium]|nr:hypothetical protein [Bryobacterales bacterium]
MTVTRRKLVTLRLAMATAALSSALATIGATPATASGPTCPGLGCTGGYLICATLTYPNGTRVDCLTQS